MRRVVICLAFLAWVLHPLSTAGAPAKPAAQPSASRQKPSEKNKPSTGVTDDKEGHEKGSDDKAKTSGKSPGEKKTWLEVFAGNVSTVRSLVADFILLAVMLSFGWAVLSEMRRTSVIIDPIEVPKDLTDAGFTPQVVAQRIAGEIIALRRQAKVRESLEEGYELSTTQLDFTVPAAGLSYRSLIRYARQLLHRPEQLVQGEIVRRLEAPAAADSGTASGTLSITLRTRERKTISVPSGKELPDLLKNAALEIAAIVDPYLVANYWFWLDQQDQDQDFKRTIDSIPKCLARTSPAEHHRAYVGWANALTMKRDFAAAEEKYATAAFLDPCFAPTFNGWGNLKRRQRRYDEAAAMYRRAIDRDPKHTAAWSNLGYTCNDRHKTRAAIRYFDRAISIDLRAASPRTGQALSFWKLGRIEWAEAAFRRAIDLDPDFGWSYLHWARLLGAQGRFAEALDLVRIAVERGSKSEGHGARGDLQLRMGNFAEAEASYRQAIEADPRSANGFSSLARLRLLQRDPVGAIQMCERALEIDHFSINALGIWADALRQMRRDEEATAKYREMLALDPYQVRAHVGMGQIARGQHRWSDALAGFKRALAIDSRDGWAWRSWGQTLIDLHRFREAEKKLRRAVEVDPFDAGGHFFLGNMLALRGKRESALDLYRRACELDGRNTDAWRQQADILIQLGKPDDALALLAGAVVAWPGEARMQLELGRALLRLGRSDEALRSFELAVSVAPRDAEVLRTWANALPATPEGQDLALRLLVRAVAAEPWNEWATVDLGRIFHRLGLTEDALRWFERAQSRAPESVVILVGWSQALSRTASEQPADAPAEREKLNAEAEEKLRQATEIDLQDPLPLREWGELLRRRNRYDLAAKTFAWEVRLNRKVGSAWARWGDSLLAMHKYRLALDRFRKAVALEPAGVSGHLGCGISLAGLGRFEGAADCYLRACKLDGRNARAWQRLAGTLMDLGRHHLALASLEGAAAAWPDDARLRLEVGRALLRLGRRGEALHHIEKAAEMAPRDVEVLRVWADAQPVTEQGRDQAMRLLVRALKADPRNEYTVSDLGRMFYRVGLTDVALHWFERAHHRFPESVAILVGWSEMCIQTANHLPEAAAVERERRFVEAEEKLRLATQIEPWNTWPLRRWAELRWQRGSVDQALAKLAKATEIDSADWQAWRASGKLHLASRRFDAAISAYKRAIVFNPADPDLLIDFGNALKQAGKRAKAMANLERALVLRPADARASKLLAELRGAQ